MNYDEFFEHLQECHCVEAGSDLHLVMHELSEHAQRVAMRINSQPHTKEEMTELLSELTGREVDSSVRVFPPFYSDCGMNIHFGKNVFINSGAKFQDQGGIYIGDGALIGHNVVLATINHDENPNKRSNMYFKPIHIGKNVWMGANVTVLPGITIGDGAIVAAGAVVTKDVPENMVVAGVPAKVIRPVKSTE